MAENFLVMYQITEQNDDEFSFVSFPAVVTSRTTRPLPKLDAKGGEMKDEKGEVIYGEPVDVLTLTVFIVGGFEFYADVVPYTDDAGHRAGARTYREWGTAPAGAAPAKKGLFT